MPLNGDGIEPSSMQRPTIFLYFGSPFSTEVSQSHMNMNAAVPMRNSSMA